MTEDEKVSKHDELSSSSGLPGSPSESSLDASGGGTKDSLLIAVAHVSEPAPSEIKQYVPGVAAIAFCEGSLIAKRYRLDRPLGRGGMGVVWEATHLVTQRRVAIKFVFGPAHQRTDMRRRFLREARAASAARHPNVVEVLDVFELEDGTPAMVMELLSGETLRDRLKRDGRLSLDATASLFLPIMDAVATAHALGIVHRDLKPENVFLVLGRPASPEVKVLDFGVAKLTALGVESIDADSLTSTGSTIGTPCYMAPEQTTGEKDVDSRADVWALGVMLYECLAGVRPLEGSGVGQVVMKLMTDGIRPIDTLVPGLPAGATALVTRMLSRARQDRPHGLEEVKSVLARYVDPSAHPSSATHDGRGRDRTPAIESATDVNTQAPQAIPVVGRQRPRTSFVVSTSGAFLLLAMAVWRAIAVSGTTLSTQKPSEATGAAKLPSAEAPPAEHAASAASVSSVTETPVAAPPAPPLPAPVRATRPRPTPTRPVGPQPPAVAPVVPEESPPGAAIASPPAAASGDRGPQASPSATTTPAPNCDPPYEYDRAGRKTWKRNCL